MTLRSRIDIRLVARLGAILVLGFVLSSSIAVHDVEILDLDDSVSGAANVVDPDPLNAPVDWDSLFSCSGAPEPCTPTAPPPGPLAGLGGAEVLAAAFGDDFVGVGPPTDKADPNIHGSNKDIHDINGNPNANDDWECGTSNNVLNKNDILNAYAALFKREADDHIYLYLGLERDTAEGTAFAGFWVFLDKVGCSVPEGSKTGAFTGQHTGGQSVPSDLLLIGDFTGGGSTAILSLFKWVGAEDSLVGSDPIDNLEPIATGLECALTPADPTPADHLACGSFNSGPINTPWAPRHAASGTSLPANTFVEFGVDLTTALGLEPGAQPCFGTFIAETRSSDEPTADLKDFVGRDFTTCGSFTVEKETIPDGSAQGFTFTGDASGTISDGGSIHLADLSQGEYTSTETIPDGWFLQDITCDDPDVVIDEAGATVTAPIVAGENITCVFTNEQFGRILVSKQTLPDGSAQTFDFTGDLGAFQLSDGQTFDSGFLEAGTYGVSETVPTGWDLSSATCDDGSDPGAIDLQPGETVTCTFTNTERGEIIVAKETVPDGSSQAFTFTPSWTDPFELTDGGSQASGPLPPGGYSVVETVPTGWALTSATCDDGSDPTNIGLGAGETVTCTFTNTEQGTITVVKETDPDGSSQAFTFSPSWGTSFQLTDGGSDTSAFLAPGTYSVSESVPPGWVLLSATCDDGSDPSDIALSAGEDVTCTFRNQEQGTITVLKETDPDGSSQAFTFSPTWGPDFELSDGGSNTSGFLPPGLYGVAETVPTGWSLQSATCDDGSSPGAISLSAGEDVTCTFTNVERGTITVVKVADPEDTEQLFDFTPSWTDPFQLAAGGATTSDPLLPNTYSVAESVPEGWKLESATCDDGSDPSSIGLDAGEDVTCTFTNLQLSSITVVKVTRPADATETFTFTPSWGDPFELAGGESNVTEFLEPGSYDVVETVPEGWTLESATCDDGSDPSAIDLGANEDVTCTFTNVQLGMITVVKATDPAGSEQAFTFSPSYDADFALKDGESNTSKFLAAGVYSVSETVPEGWVLLGATCDDGSDPAAIELAEGEHVTCTFRNQEQGTITVVKQTDPDGSLEAFTFTPSWTDPFQLTDGGSQTSGFLAPGVYSVAETVPEGWVLLSATCDDGSDPSEIALSAGEDVTCTFRNQEQGTITVVKQTDPDGSAQAFTFSPSYDADFALTDGESNTSKSLAPGTYSVSESVPPGWLLLSATCDDGSDPSAIDLAAGEDVTCTFTNEEQGTITVVKQTQPDGAAQAFTFSPSYDADFALTDGESNTSKLLGPGVYSVAETVPEGWTLESATCDDGSDPSAIDLAAGEDVTCTFTNVQLGIITVVKATDPAGSEQAFTFSPSYDADFALKDGGSNTSKFLATGVYSVSETVPAGWVLLGATCDDGSDPASIELAEGEHVTCTFRNQEQGTITVVKQTDPDGSLQAFTFTPSWTDSFQLTDGGSQTSGFLAPGIYSVAESVPEGWVLLSATCDDGSDPSEIALSAGEDVTCTFRNQEQGTITVVKQTDPDGSAQAFTFSPSYDADFALTDGESNTSGLLAPGTYSVSESVPPGWVLLSATCDDGSDPSAIDLAAGEDVTCTFTNEEQGTITVVKATSPADSPQAFTFSPSYDADFALKDGESNTSKFLGPGVYSVAETVPEGWTLESATCDDGSDPSEIDLAAGEDVTCTFRNVQLGMITVVKATDPAGSEQAFTFSPSYDADFALKDGGSNTSKFLAAGVYSVSETVPAGWVLLGATCDDGSDPASIELAEGEHVTCTFRNQEQGTITVVKQTDPDGSLQAFTFTPSWTDPFQLTDGESEASGFLAPGIYSVAETVPEGWVLLSAICDDGSDPAAIALSAGEDVTCTFRNQEQGTITVVKQTDPDGSAQAFTFSPSYDAAFALKDGESNASKFLAPGVYSVGETVPPGWILLSATCDDGSDPAAIDLSAGEDVTCTFTNEEQGTITVVKETDPDGSAQAFTFSPSYDAAFALKDGESNTSKFLAPGTYSVSESVPPAWVLLSATCDDGSDPAAIDLSAGEDVTCTFTNEEQGTITVVKETDPDGSAQAFTFSPSYDADFALKDGESNTSKFLSPGVYSVSESVPPGWQLVAATCDDGSDPSAIDLSAGEDVTCTFRNQELGTITVVKQTDPDGSLQAFTFTPSWTDPFQLTDGESEASGFLAPGIYSVAETVPEGWQLLSATCDDGSDPANIALSPGEDVTCTFRNQQMARVTVAKETIPDGATESFSFTPSWGPAFSLTDGTSETSPYLSPGTYSVSESPPPGWVLKSATCSDGSDPASIGLSPGEEVTCTFTNEAQGDVTVDKTASGPHFGADAETGTFTLVVTSKGPGPAIEVTLDDTLVGTGWSLGGPDAAACTLTPAANDALHCEFGTMAVGDTRTVTASRTLTTADCADVPNTARVDALIDLDRSDNQDSATLVVLCPTRTIGFWSTHHETTKTVWADVTAAGDNVLCGVAIDDPKMFGGFWASISQTSTGEKREKIDHARMQLLQQLLASILNDEAFGTAPPGLIDSARAALCGDDLGAIRAAAGATAAYNESGDADAWPEGTSPSPADPGAAQAEADVAYWDSWP